MSIVVFNEQAFALRYPEFSAVNPTLLNAYFNEATIYCSNDNITAPITDINLRTVCLNMLTAHIAALSGAANATPGPAMVGRIDQASEGTVSVHAAMNGAPSGSQAWYQQTQYGAAYWQATKSFRTMRYRPRNARFYPPGMIP